MKQKSFEFNLRELAGSMGDFGVLIPLAVGYFAVIGLNPSGFFVMMGLACIVTGLVFKLPMPIQPMKVLAVMSIAQVWTPSMVYASGFAEGLIWLFFGLTNLVKWLARITPKTIVWGIQITLGILLAIQAVEMISTGWVLGIISILIILLLRKVRYIPAPVVLLLLGVGIVVYNGGWGQIPAPAFNLPTLTSFRLEEIWDTLVLAGFAQIPLTITNATISVAALISTYFPEKKVTTRQLSLSHGLMNLVVPFFGGIPMCHGAGGLAGQYYFGARTGGTKIIEGSIYITLGLFFGASFTGLFSVFPRAILGAMLFLIGLELVKFGRELRFEIELVPVGLTVITALLSNLALGFLVGLGAYHLIHLIIKRKINSDSNEKELTSESEE
jgi:MFS superfamily sulfate permease-like transporter